MYQKSMKAFLLPRSYVAYDLETSGFFYDGGEIVEIGAVKVIDGKPTDQFSELCSLDGTMNPAAAAKNHITDSMLVGARTLKEVFADFVEFIGDLPLVGFNNKRFDDLFVKRECERHGIRDVTTPETHDAQKMHGGNPSLQSCCEEFGIVNNDAHRALSDAVATQELFENLRYKWQLESTDVRDIAAEVLGDELQGQTVCFSGTTDFFPKRQCQTLALAHGAILSNSVTKKVTLLVNLEGRESAQVIRASRYGIKTIDGYEFLKLINEPSDRPAHYDILQTGKWFTELGDETVLMIKRELSLPLKKDLVYYHVSGLEAVPQRNHYGIDVLAVRDKVASIAVVDVRAVETCHKCGFVTLEVILEGAEDPVRLLAPYLADMQKGKEHFIASLSGSEAEE